MNKRGVASAHINGYKMKLTKKLEAELGQAKKENLQLRKTVEKSTIELEQKNQELEIEAALERVRARTMAMQKSDELREAVRVIYEQLQHLGFDSNACNIIIIDKESGNMQYWVSGFTQEIFPEGYYVPYFSHPYHEELIAASRQNKKYEVMEYSGETKKSFDDIFFTQTDFKKIPEEAKAFMKALKSVKLSTAFFTYGALQVLGPTALIGERRKILDRFAKVFDLTYTRFLDLQKAEEQAREAQIQLALERVRARTMAMQHSDELKDAAALLFQQVKSLGVPAYSCGYNIWEKDDKEFTSWMSTQDGSDFNAVLNIPLTEDANFIRFADSRKKDEQFFVLELRGKRMQEHYQYLKTIPAFKAYFDYAVSVGFDLPETQIHHLANFSQGNLLFITLEPCPEFHDVFKRFAAVFDQTYTRFLDLQKAEAQAKEAKIEAALEKVRSRTMAMQRSDELADVAQLLFQQVKDLGITAWTTGFNIWQPDNAAYIDWVTDPAGGFLEPYTVQATVHPAFRAIREARLRGDDFFVSYLEGEQIIETYQFLNSFGDKGQFQKILESGFQYPTRQFNHLVFGAQVSLLFITYEPCPEAHDIFKRFGKVFEQTYTRFLDLKKAEAQAREAKIEAALEKVRSRSLAMHKSDEIEEVLHT
ncbi:MAG TPA: hypothetical protein VFD56_11855, partial [Chitinophagaceae bacterium]|nr:hypothetical protein [Chitinophagaceae bacterium]